MHFTHHKQYLGIVWVLLLAFAEAHIALAQQQPLADVIKADVRDFMRRGNIPGLSLAMVRGDSSFLVHFGYADPEKKVAVGPNTLFELGSASKAFTALAVLQLEHEGKLRLDNRVTDYIPGFMATFNGQKVPITLGQLLYHTSGIPWYKLADIPPGNGEQALEEAMKRVSGVKLLFRPGKKFHYTSVNYDLLGLVIEKVTRVPFETYLKKAIFEPAGMHSSFVGWAGPEQSANLAQGHKMSFFAGRPYDAPTYQGNNPAGYVISSTPDLHKWLRLQLNPQGTLAPLVRRSHLRDETVAPQVATMTAYAAGWFASLAGDGQLFHEGLNPSFSSFIAVIPQKQLGIVILTNAGSTYTGELGRRLVKRMTGEEIGSDENPGDDLDKFFSVVSILLAVFILAMLTFMGWKFMQYRRGSSSFRPLSSCRKAKMAAYLLLNIPLLYGIYLIPQALSNFGWEAAVVWAPGSFAAMVGLLLAALAFGFLAYLASELLWDENTYRRSLPLLVFLNIIVGIANVMLILIISTALNHSEEGEVKYLLYYFALTFALYIGSRQFVQTRLTQLTLQLIHDIRVKLIDKVIGTPYQQFEKLNRGRVYTTLNDDTSVIGNSANIAVEFTTNCITMLGAFLYLATIAFWATVTMLVVILIIAGMYYWVSRRADVLFEKTRNVQEVYLRQLNGLLDGFKELSLHREKKQAYERELNDSVAFIRRENGVALVNFINTFLIGESLLILLLGLISFVMPVMFPDIARYTLISFMLVLLYLVGPINGILNSVPDILRARVSWNKIKSFLREIPASAPPEAGAIPAGSTILELSVHNVCYHYRNKAVEENFSLGPVNLTAAKGEVLFIIGGNGSGKTTLSKLMTGLYTPDAGEIRINGRRVAPTELGEYFSVVFNPNYLFDKIYNFEALPGRQKLNAYLEELKLGHKVRVTDGIYSTIDLSQGQRKRLSLLQCYLEDKPVYLFDEWAADQDPEFRKFFYREILPGLKAKGKIVIAITHDDHFFDVADAVIKLNHGKVEYLKENTGPMLN